MFNKTNATILAAFLAAQSLTGCFGKFTLTQSLYKFHDGLLGNDMGSKAIKSIILIIVGPFAYGLSAFGDIIIFNLIEFWTGTNPLAMAPGKSEVQYITYHKRHFKMTATTNRMLVEELKAGEVVDYKELVFDTNQQNLFLVEGPKRTAIGTYTLQPAENLALSSSSIKLSQSN